MAQVEVEAHYEAGWYWLTEVGSHISLAEAGGNMTDMKSQPRGLLSQDDPFSQFWWPSSLSSRLTVTTNYQPTCFTVSIECHGLEFIFKILIVRHWKA